MKEYYGNLDKARKWLGTRKDCPEYMVLECKDGRLVYVRGEDNQVAVSEEDAKWISTHAVGMTHNHPHEGPRIEEIADQEGWPEEWKDLANSLSTSDLVSGALLGLEWVEAVMGESVVGVRFTRPLDAGEIEEIHMNLRMWQVYAEGHDGFMLWRDAKNVEEYLGEFGIEYYRV